MLPSGLLPRELAEHIALLAQTLGDLPFAVVPTAQTWRQCLERGLSALPPSPLGALLLGLPLMPWPLVRVG